MTSGTPVPCASGASQYIKGPTISPPTAGMNNIHHQDNSANPSGAVVLPPEKPQVAPSMRYLNPMAAKPPPMPINSAATTMKVYRVRLKPEAFCISQDSRFQTEAGFRESTGMLPSSAKLKGNAIQGGIEGCRCGARNGKKGWLSRDALDRI